MTIFPDYMVAIAPAQAAQLPGAFASGPESLSYLLEHAPEFRQHGWDLSMRGQAKIVNGEFLEIMDGTRKAVRLYEDGSLVVRASVDPNFLGWGSFENPTQPRVYMHALASIEFTTAVVYLYKEVAGRLDPKPAELTCSVQLRNTKTDDEPLHIVPYKLNSIAWTFRNDAGVVDADKVEKTVTLKTAELLSDPDATAFRLVERLFLFFGIASDRIPYTTEGNRIRRVDVDAIRRIQ
jgi:hypothetical protein